MQKLFKKWYVVVLAVVILGAATAGVAVAASSSNSGSLQSRYQVFMSNLASTLNISPGTLTADIKTASTQTVNQELASGQITNQQATKMLSRINSGQPFLMGMGCGFRKGSGGGSMILKPAASALSMTPQALIAALRGGQTVAALASTKGTTVAALQTAILNSVQNQLAQAVTNGKLTQTQENKILQNINSGNWVTQLQNIGKHQHPATS